MKALRSKKLAAMAMAVVLLAGMLPLGVSAMSGCTDGLHQPGDTLYPANWNSETGGYGYDYYLCTVCGGACNANGGSEVFVGPENGCSGGYKCHVPDLDAPYVTACNSNTGFYYCKACKQIVDAEGTIADVSTLGGHTPGDSLKPADYKPCVGGHQSAYYICTVCEAACEADGSAAPYTRGTRVHRPGTTLYPADWNSTNGGYVVEHYLCEDCGWGCDAVGNAEMFVGPGDECAVGKHTPGTEWHEADYTPCNGGYKSGWYECSQCHQPCDAGGKAVEWEPGTGTHTRGTEEFPADYTPCNGGYRTAHYECEICHCPLDAEGNMIDWEPGTGEHTRGTEEFPADYTPCFGGFRTTHYECVDCHCPLDAEGNMMEPEEGTGAHTPGTEKHEPDYMPCSGGFVDEWYECEACHQPCAADGGEAAWEEAKEEHRIVAVPEKAPTYESEGNWAYWECEVCHSIYRDAEGTEMIESWDEIVRPKLKPEESSSMETTIKEGLNEVPEAVAKQYPTVEEIHKALQEKAFSGNAAMKEENTGSMLLDVSLQIKTAGGELIPVDPENFPEEGVEVLLPYPEGTDRSYTFVITHMITSGERTGEIEVLSYRAERDGLRVRFTSMSPVCITYLVKQPAEVTVTIPAANPTTGAGSPMLPMAALCGGALVVLLAVKKKER